MIITIKESDKEKAKRLMLCDDAFSLLWDIDQKLRNYIKYDTTLDKYEICREIRECIAESNLLELYQ